MATLRKTMLALASDQDSMSYVAARDELLAMLMPYTPSEVIQFKVITALWSLLLVIHVGLLAMRIRRAQRGQEAFWVVRQVKREQGTYHVPDARLAWTLPAIVFCSVEVAHFALLLASLEAPYRHLATVNLLYTTGHALILFGLTLSAGSLAFSALATVSTTMSDRAQQRRNPWLRRIARLPSPLVYHSVLYFFGVVWIVLLTSLAIWTYIGARDAHSSQRLLLSALNGVLSGTGSSAMAASISTLAPRVAAATQTLCYRQAAWNIAILCCGGIIFFLYVPLGLTLIWQLRRHVRRSQTSGSQGTGVQSNVPTMSSARYTLVTAHAIIFLIVGSFWFPTTVYEIWALYRGESFITDKFIARWSLVFCILAFSLVLVAHSVPTRMPGRPSAALTSRRHVSRESRSVLAKIAEANEDTEEKDERSSPRSDGKTLQVVLHQSGDEGVTYDEEAPKEDRSVTTPMVTLTSPV